MGNINSWFNVVAGKVTIPSFFQHTGCPVSVLILRLARDEGSVLVVRLLDRRASISSSTLL